jgi:K+-transporting ATPase KdpF subunit
LGGPRDERRRLRGRDRRLFRAGGGLCALLRPHALSGARSPFTMENIVIGLIALACLVYLIVAVLRPEKF